jgi:hypothetical protein
MISSSILLVASPKPALSNSLYNGVAAAVTTAVAAVAPVVLARAPGPEQRGAYSEGTCLIVIATWLANADLLLVITACLLFLLFAPYVSSLMGWDLDLGHVRVSGLSVLALWLLELGMAILRGLQECRSLAAPPILDSMRTLRIIVVIARYSWIAILTTSTALGEPLLRAPLRIRLVRRNRGCAHPATVWRPMRRYSPLVFLATVANRLGWRRCEGARQADLPGLAGYTQLWRENDARCRMPSE